jgi:hypothetical protein
MDDAARVWRSNIGRTGMSRPELSVDLQKFDVFHPCFALRSNHVFLMILMITATVLSQLALILA